MEKETIKKLALCEVIEYFLGGDMFHYAKNIIENDPNWIDAYDEWQESTVREEHELNKKIKIIKEQIINFIDNLDFEESQVLIDCIHDILVQLNGTEPNDIEILEVIKDIPKSILSIGIAWGYSDTVFGDELYVWIRDNKSSSV
ncbi:hypothetical protein NE686_17655 [Tissierella carlieri]|uniref:Uncharacterized protein n=1 Tax=Tissierella carlieri TaxID=689904 RepID=A0ABT1SG87_9FIRM|nr:hypothetical protein [Tissierella carlieri]MCQ4924932.1 hypothetical protein [Tissierella carlieri]